MEGFVYACEIVPHPNSTKFTTREIFQIRQLHENLHPRNFPPSWFTIPRNLRSFDVLVGGFIFSIASASFGYALTPSGPTMCPKNVIVVMLYSHFSLLSVYTCMGFLNTFPDSCRVPLGCSQTPICRRSDILYSR